MAESTELKTIGAYRLLRQLGAGGMGRVYEVEHIRLGVKYAMKTFAVDGANRERLKKRFLAEGRLLAHLRSPRVVRVYDMDFSEDLAWFTMDFVASENGEPRTLADVQSGGLESESRLIGWYDDVREALETVHAAGIIHRDVKLENVLIGPDGRAVLSDFGISKVVDEQLRKAVELSRTMVTGEVDRKTMIGTIAYLSPELRNGGETTAAVDLYALGIAFFRLLTGIWYEPGPRAFDMLAPFSPRWRLILASLLADDPKSRRLIPFRKPCSHAKIGGKSAFIFVIALVGALLTGWIVWRLASGEIAPETDESSPFEIPASIK